MEAGGGEAGGSCGDGQADEGGHDVGLGWGVGFGVGDEDGDAGAEDAARVGWRGLGQDDAGCSGGGDVGGGAEVQLEAAEHELGRALGLAGDVRDGDVLAAKALRDTDLAAAADEGAGGGRLGEDVVLGDAGGVEAVLHGEVEAKLAGGCGGVLIGETGEGRDVHLAAMDGETHGREGGEDRHDEHEQASDDAVEDVFHRLDRIQGRGLREEG